jgi:hypothetical protein
MTAVFGLDLGQQSDFTALAGLEQGRGADGLAQYAVRHLRRWPLGTPYPAVVADVERLFGRPEVADALVAVDQTGVGRPVVDLFRASGRVNLLPVTITAGHAVTQAEDGRHVPKKVLVSTVQVLLQSRRLTIARGLKESGVLVKELLNFKVRVTPAANETFGCWREGAHDDLVLAVALAAWAGENVYSGPWEVTDDPDNRSLMSRAPEGVFAEDLLGKPW